MAFRQELREKVEALKQTAREANAREADRGTGLLEGFDPIVDTSTWPVVGDGDGPVGLEDQVHMSGDDLEALLADVEASFEPFMEGSLASFDEMLTTLDEDVFRRTLRKARNEDLPFVKSELSGWVGQAGDMFRMYYLRGWETSVDYQLAYVQEIGRVVHAYRKLLAHTQDDIKAIANDAIAALNREDPPGDASGFFTILGVIASVAQAEPHVGAAITVASLFVSGIAEEGARGAGDNPERQVEGEFVFQILRTTREAITRLNELVDTQTERIRNAINDDLDQVEGPNIYVREDGEGGGMILERPDVRLAPPPGQSSGELSVDLTKLHMAGWAHLPAAAYRYEEARLQLLAVADRRDIAFGTPSPLGPLNSYYLNRLCERCEYALRSTRDILMETGDALVFTAATYAQTDAEAAELMREQTAIELENFETPTLREESPRTPAILND
ncbi:hypothetical protein ACTMTJ_43770 [Phytohabitans sp. LJ34]|uniref:hypothetical protein n=1 Tax=Phytohabitans sp. LJ34 TaxID=3452217 RepID=UPI003F8CE1FE